jgi:mRNA-degrading endonuclease RelE of RelBE toxin-antitoxin system
MPKIEVSPRFLQAYRELPPEVQAKVKKALRLLSENPRHPSLQTKPIQGAPGIYEARIDRRYRLTYARLPGDILQIRVVGAHDETLNNP